LKGLIMEESYHPCASRPLSLPMLRDRFLEWADRLRQHSFSIAGAVFICDARGHLAGYLWSAKDSADDLFKVYTLWNRRHSGINAVSECLETFRPSHVSAQQHNRPQMEGFDSYASPILGADRKLQAVLGIFTCSPCSEDILNHVLPGLALSLESWLREKSSEQQFYETIRCKEREARTLGTLFESVRGFYLLTDADAILEEMQKAVNAAFSGDRTHLSLDLDTGIDGADGRLGEKLKSAGAQAVRERKTISLRIDTESGAHWLLAVPLPGENGPCGLLRLIRRGSSFAPQEISFVTMLANAAGTALEQTRKYAHVGQRLRELELINEMTARLNLSLELNEIYPYVTCELAKIFTADFCLLMQMERNAYLRVRACNREELAGRMIEADFRQSLFLENPQYFRNIPDEEERFGPILEAFGCHSMISAPIDLGGETWGVLIVARRSREAFRSDQSGLLQLLAGHIERAAANASLHAEVSRLVITDRLTGLYARHFLNEQVDRMQARDTCGTLIVIDIDKFKNINDTYGHLKGDEILMQVSGIVKASIREGDIAARWGGEELAVYLPQVLPQQALRIAERIRNRVCEETFPQVTVSCGISHWNRQDAKIGIESLFYRADMALYEAKRHGRNQIRLA